MSGTTETRRHLFRRLRGSDIRVLASESFCQWSRHNDSRLGASLSFYALLSVTPLLLVALSLAGLVFSAEAAEGQLLGQIQHFVGPQGAAGVQAMLAGLNDRKQGIVATVFGSLILVFGASKAFLELRNALDTIWEVASPPTTTLGGLIQTVKERLFSFALVLSVGLLLLVSVIVNAWLIAAGAFLSTLLHASESLLHFAGLLLSFTLTMLLFAVTYKVVPKVRIEWRDVLVGSAVTSLLFTIGKVLIGVYLGMGSFASIYGAGASVIMLIVWMYYSAQIFFLGAEFTRAFAIHYGSRQRRALR